MTAKSSEWTEKDASEFREGLKKMGFDRCEPDAEDYAHGTERWSISLRPGKKKAKPKTPRTTLRRG